MDVSIIVCTYNRAGSLKRTLESLARLEVSAGITWEVIVVDNNSSDGTCAVVDETRAHLGIPNLRYVFEQNQGLSYARNQGICMALGDLILFTDDDVCPEPDWVCRIVEGFKQFSCSACGGHISPIWEVPPPEWLSERLYGFLALRLDETGPRQITGTNDLPFGANMAFRRSVFAELGGFNTELGRKGNVLAGSEELDLFERILRDKGVIYYIPQARVHHRIEASRTRKRYFRRWRFQGSQNLAEHAGAPGDRTILGVPPYIIRQLGGAFFRALSSRFTLTPDDAFLKEMIVWHFLGLIRGLHLRNMRQREG